MDIDKKIRLHTGEKKEISLNNPHDHCDFCGDEINEPPYMNMGKTMCPKCFWEWLANIGIRKE